MPLICAYSSLNFGVAESVIAKAASIQIDRMRSTIAHPSAPREFVIRCQALEVAMRPFSAGLFLLLGSAAFAQQAVPEIAFDAAPNFLKMPADLHLGEVSGVAVNSKG